MVQCRPLLKRLVREANVAVHEKHLLGRIYVMAYYSLENSKVFDYLFHHSYQFKQQLVQEHLNALLDSTLSWKVATSLIHGQTNTFQAPSRRQRVERNKKVKEIIDQF